MHKLRNILRFNRSITILKLNKNDIDNEGAQALSEVLEDNRTLTKLKLSDNKIGDEGAEVLSEALKNNQTLCTLKLGENRIGPDGALALSEALTINRTLITLKLRNNRIFDEGAEALNKVLTVNQTLTLVDLEHNEIETIDTAIYQAIQTNRNRLKNIRNQTVLTILILLRHICSLDSKLPYELWKLIMSQLDFSSIKIGYRTSVSVAYYLSQKNIFSEFNRRLRLQQSFRLVEKHGVKVGESRLSFLVPNTVDVPKPMQDDNLPETQAQSYWQQLSKQ